MTLRPRARLRDHASSSKESVRRGAAGRGPTCVGEEPRRTQLSPPQVDGGGGADTPETLTAGAVRSRPGTRASPAPGRPVGSDAALGFPQRPSRKRPLASPRPRAPGRRRRLGRLWQRTPSLASGRRPPASGAGVSAGRWPPPAGASRPGPGPASSAAAPSYLRELDPLSRSVCRICAPDGSSDPHPE